MNRTTISLIAAGAALAALTGFATVAASGATEGADRVKAASRMPVEHSALLCPAPTSSEVGETTYTSFTPPGATDVKDTKDAKGAAGLLPARSAKKSGEDGKDGAKKDAEPVAPLTEAGRPVTATTERSDAPALVGTVDGALAPGWTVQQTTTVRAGSGRGLLGLTCTAPGTDFWFPGTGTGKGREDYVHLTNPDDTTAVVALELHGTDGPLPTSTGEGIEVPAHSTVPVLLSTLTDARTADATLHVVAREGRVGAAVQATDSALGGDWLPAAARPAPSVVLPGIPADATSVRLVVIAPGETDADLKVELATPTGRITPVGLERLHLRSGMTTAVDLKDVTKGEAGSLVLTPAGKKGEGSPVVAALQVVRGKGDRREMAFIPATAPVEQRATAADNRAKGSTLSLVAPEKGKDAKVKVTASVGSEGGESVSKTYTVKGGTTLAVEPPVPSGLKGSYALTVEPEEGSGAVYAARTLALEQNGIASFTIQTLPDDRGTVVVPRARQDLSLLTN